MLSPIPMIGYHSLVASISRADLMARQKMTLDAALAQVVHLNETGQLQQSLHLARQVAQAAPVSAVAQNVLSAAAEATGDLAEAEKAARAAIRIDPQMVDAHYNLGNALRRLGRYKEAIDALQRARSLAPQDLDVLFNLSLSFQEISQFERAIEGFRQVLAIDPEHDSAALGLVLCLTSEDEQEEAEELARHLINRTPKDERVWAVLFDGKRRRNDLAGLKQMLEQAAQALGSSNAVVHLAKAHILREEKQVAEATALLESISAPRDHGADFAATHAEMLGKLLDQQNETAKAFEQFSIANRVSLDRYGGRLQERDNYLQRLRNRADTFTPQWFASWTPHEGEHSQAEPVLLVGFPRSGTTLLDTILRSHSRVSVLEEQPVTSAVVLAVRNMLGDETQALASLTPAQLTSLQEAYLSALEQYRPEGDTSDILVNKMPLSMLEAGLVHRLFPRAKFILALRHPCDCVLSCFMQRFKLNAAMSNFVEIGQAARFYDVTFSLWQQYLDVLPLQVHSLRYEDLIASFDETIAPVMPFLSLDWEDGVRDYIETARTRGRINTPSFNQVTQPLYTSASGRWRRYADQMAPALPLLAPWAEKFGYEV